MDAAADAESSAQDARKAIADVQEAKTKAINAAQSANQAAERGLQLLDVKETSFGNTRLRVAVGEGLSPSKSKVEFLGKEYNAKLTINYPS